MKPLRWSRRRGDARSLARSLIGAEARGALARSHSSRPSSSWAAAWNGVRLRRLNYRGANKACTAQGSSFTHVDTNRQSRNKPQLHSEQVSDTESMFLPTLLNKGRRALRVTVWFVYILPFSASSSVFKTSTCCCYVSVELRSRNVGFYIRLVLIGSAGANTILRAQVHNVV